MIADNQVNVAERSELIYDAVLAAANLREKIVNLEAHLKDLENQQKNLILKAEKAGTVYSRTYALTEMAMYGFKERGCVRFSKIN